MSLIPWRPFFDIEKFFEEDDWFMPVFSRRELLQPAVDVYETEKEVVAEVAVPDFNPEDIEISVENGLLKVKGERKEEKEEKKKGYWKREIRRGSFERAVRLPVPVKEGAAEATYEKGILKIVIPKVEAKPSSKVKIKVKNK